MATLDDLVPEFADKVSATLEECAAQGVEMRVHSTLRDLEEQAELFSRGRETRELAMVQKGLALVHAEYLAGIVGNATPQPEKRMVTKTPPGFSWHNWGEAVDCYWIHNGEISWDAEILGERNGYRVYTRVAESLGLYAGGIRSSLVDWPHLQLRIEPSALHTHPLPTIDIEMRQRFEQQEDKK